MGKKCTCRTGDCISVTPGVVKCRKCGQLFVFIGGPNRAGRYVRFERLTDEDRANFDPEMEREFLDYMKSISGGK